MSEILPVQDEPNLHPPPESTSSASDKGSVEHTETGTSAPSPSAGGQIGAGGKVYPKGVVLGKDGKPCRTCTSVQDWLKLANASTKRSQNTNTNSSTTASTTSSLTTTTASNPPLECPPDSIALGRSSWTLLHTLSATYPVAPSPAEKSTMHTFLTTFSVLYPCWPCAKDFQEWMARPENRLNGTGSWLESRERLGLWMCRAHNEVNRKLGKGEFDCGRWEERWRTGCGAEVD